jgi:hypothetical protein
LLRGHSALCARVERTLALNRKAGLNFPGVFVEVMGREKRNDALRLQFYDDPLFHDGRGELSWVALGLLPDLVLGGVTRLQGGTTRRPATVHLARGRRSRDSVEIPGPRPRAGVTNR